MTTFIHTSDWQLGMTRRFLRHGAGERYAAARLDAIRSIGRAARDTGAEFVVVAGDVFESNQVGRRVILQALEALRDVPVPVYLLPAPPDPQTQTRVYRAPVFTDNRPGNVHVVTNEEPIRVTPEVELVGAPWPAKRLAANPLHAVLDRLTPAAGIQRIALAHGPLDGPAGFPDSAAAIRYNDVRAALDDRRIQYLALGDRHSYTLVGGDERIVYSGTPEVTAFRDPDAGHVNVVRLGPDGVRSEKYTVGTWRFLESEFEITGQSDADDCVRQVEALPDKPRTVLRLHLFGVVDLGLAAALQARFGRWEDVFASVEIDSARLHTAVPDDDPLWDRFGGFAAKTVADLRDTVTAGGPDAETARDALLLFLGLTSDTALAAPSIESPIGGTDRQSRKAEGTL
ncbi:MAG: DNA repair exonuclease [Planctomycetaceae bacterium]|nr:DNA repair exonuclease [Planctomycetaceae bacterium]